VFRARLLASCSLVIAWWRSSSTECRNEFRHCQHHREQQDDRGQVDRRERFARAGDPKRDHQHRSDDRGARTIDLHPGRLSQREHDVVGLVNLRNVYTTSAALEHTYAVKIALQQLLAATLDAETGERGFIITGAASYLEPYERARVRLSANLAQLRALTVGNREHQADVDRLAAATELKLEELALAIRQRRESASRQLKRW